jgi:hypothetical protein
MNNPIPEILDSLTEEYQLLTVELLTSFQKLIKNATGWHQVSVDLVLKLLNHLEANKLISIEEITDTTFKIKKEKFNVE